MARRGFLKQSLSIVFGTLAGCMSSTQNNDNETEKEVKKSELMDKKNTTGRNGANALFPPLPGLISAKNRTSYASNHSLQYENGNVVVEVILTGREQPTEYLESIEQQQGSLLRGGVAVKNLQSLADDPRVKAVRQPAQPKAT